MYRCIECKAVFEYKPDYCDCGNDTFEQIIVEQPPLQQSYTANIQNNSQAAKKTYSTQEIISMAIFAVCIVLSVLAWIFVGNNAPASSADTQNSYDQTVASVPPSSIPDIEQIWDSTPPASQKQIGDPMAQPTSNQLLNTRMATMSPDLTNYIVTLGQTFVSAWPRGEVAGDGACEIEFSINGGDGRIVNKKIHKASDNKTLNDSIATMLENVTQTSVPPQSYHGEKIIMAFSVLHREYKVYYPHY